MGTLAMLTTDEVIDRVLGTETPGHGDVREQLRAARDAAWAATSPRLLELCRVRIAMLLGCDAETEARTPGTEVDDELIRSVAAWPTDRGFSAADRACLAFTEHYVMDVASLTDQAVTDVREHLGDEGVQNFVSALLIVEQRIRLRLAWDRLMGGR